MTHPMTDSRLAALGAHTVLKWFEYYHDRFQAITLRAKERFETCDWVGASQDAAERLDLYTAALQRLISDIRELLGERLEEKNVWSGMKAVYSALIASRDDWEIAESFFNSLTRRIFATVGIDQQIEFVSTDFAAPPTPSLAHIYRTHNWNGSAETLIADILSAYPFDVAYADRQHDVQAAAAVVDEQLAQIAPGSQIASAEMIPSVFYRGKGAYLVGRLVLDNGQATPLAIALLHTSEGLIVDAVLLREEDVSILFSFTRSYFLVDVDRPYDLVQFLKGIMPHKRIAELYISIGYHKHGKTELYRNLQHHLTHTDEQFVIAPGIKGMVMLVFTMPSYDLVFKVIKDRFDQPKNSTAQEVKAKYTLVFRHDRAGRLIDAQEFEHLSIDRARFSPGLLEELQRFASSTVEVTDTHVALAHLYVERRVVPLNMYIQEHGTAAEPAVIDYGNTLKDLAATNIFPGDVLIKNFGVTRHGRVVFYDYDELCLLTDCVFRDMPVPTTYEEEMAEEPWYSVGPNDIFPEELQRFLGLPGELRKAFLKHHADLFRAVYWRDIQERIKAGVILDIFPYDQSQRLNSRPPTSC